MPPTQQQQQIIAHDHNRHGRVIAGPGTGKSWTAIALLRRLHDDHPELVVGLLTFTRAATGELVVKIANEGLDWLAPGTIHSFALRLLIHNPGTVAIPHPVRLPDTWETEELIRPYLASQLRSQGHAVVTTRTVDSLEREMSARWESLDPNLITLAAIHPLLRNAYIGAWNSHRWRYGYLLLAELPSRAGDLIADFDVDLDGLGFLIVDEFQDLNKADIRLLANLAEKGVKILAIGDDDQSIYRFRMAAPEGLRQFEQTFDDPAEYPLSVGLRCGRNIIEAASTVIETLPNRPARPRLTAKDGAVNGDFVYLRFSTQNAEARGVARLVADRIAKGVEPRSIAILVRSQVKTWADLVGPELTRLNIPFMDADWVERTLAERALRFALAVARLTQDRTDSLALWTLLQLTNGISAAFRSYIDQSCQDNERAGQALLRLYPAFTDAPTVPSRENARRLIMEQLAVVDGINLNGVQLDEEGWGGWLRRRVPAGTLSPDADKLLASVGRAVPPDDGLGHFLGQLEPVGKDLAAKENVVRIMSITTSKGLTLDSAILMGCEAGIMPHPRGTPDEELRLLYVAITRAVNFMALTAAVRRTGPTARHGSENVNQPRGRCPMLDALPIGEWQDGRLYVQNLTGA